MKSGKVRKTGDLLGVSIQGEPDTYRYYASTAHVLI